MILAKERRVCIKYQRQQRNLKALLILEVHTDYSRLCFLKQSKADLDRNSLSEVAIK